MLRVASALLVMDGTVMTLWEKYIVQCTSHKRVTWTVQVEATSTLAHFSINIYAPNFCYPECLTQTGLTIEACRHRRIVSPVERVKGHVQLSDACKCPQTLIILRNHNHSRLLGVHTTFATPRHTHKHTHALTQLRLRFPPLS